MPSRKVLLILLIAMGLVAVLATGMALRQWRLANDSRTPDSKTSTPASASQDAASRAASGPQYSTPHSTEAGRYQLQEIAEQGTGVFINERQLIPQQVRELIQLYRYPPPRGHFWYDSRSGLYGLWGHETAGFIHPGHDFGPLPANASNGNTGVFINGRELNMTEVIYCQQLFGDVRRGRAWLDGRTGYIGEEGNPMPIANLWTALQQAQRSRSNKQWNWRDGSGAAMASDGNCTMMAVPGAPVYGSSGCN